MAPPNKRKHYQNKQIKQFAGVVKEEVTLPIRKFLLYESLNKARDIQKERNKAWDKMGIIIRRT